MQLNANCYEADFMENWRESKERLQINAPTMISDQDEANIPGKRSKITAVHQTQYSNSSQFKVMISIIIALFTVSFTHLHYNVI